MYNLEIARVAYVVDSTLDTALRTQFGDRISGYSYNGDTFTVHFFEPFNAADETAAQSVLDTHDPVIIQAARDGAAVTVTFAKPRNVDSATELTPVVDGVSYDPLTLTDNVAEVIVNCGDEIVITIAEDYPHNEVIV